MLPLLYCTHTVKSNHLAKPRPPTYLYTLSRYYMSKLLIDCYCKLRKKACCHIRVEIANRSAGQSPFPESGVIVMTVVSPNQWPCFSASQSRTDSNTKAPLRLVCPKAALNNASSVPHTYFLASHVLSRHLLPLPLKPPPKVSGKRGVASSNGRGMRLFILLIRLSACKK
jgi:hypothetical protein